MFILWLCLRGGCPCGGEDIRPVKDAVESAVYTAVKTDVKVDAVEESRSLEEAGGIGAILRY